MDRIWLDNQLDLKMTLYTIMNTDCERGFLEFNKNCCTLANMQYYNGEETVTIGKGTHATTK